MGILAFIASKVLPNSILSILSETDKCEKPTFTVYDSEGFIRNTDDEDYFSSMLPQEMILNIFQFLSIRDLRICATVSKYWLMLCSSAELYRDITIRCTSIEVSFLERILNCNVKSIHFVVAEIIDRRFSIPPFFKTERFNSLQTIVIFHSCIKFELIEELLTLSPNLKEIKLSLLDGNISANFFRHIVKLQFLEKLNLSWGEIKDVPEIVKIFKNAEKFKKLDTLAFFRVRIKKDRASAQSRELFDLLLSLCPNLEDLDLPEQHISETAFGYILTMKHLKHLNFGFTTIHWNFDLLFTDNYEKWVNLRELNIVGITADLPEKIKERLLNLSPNLESLRIEGVFTNLIFEQIMKMRKLVHLDFIRVDLSKVNDFRNYEKFCRLHTLSLVRNVSLTTCLLSELLSCCDDLKELTIHGLNVNDYIFRKILEMRNLEHLNFAGCNILLADKTEGNFINSGTFEKLNHLNLMFEEPDINPIYAEGILSSCKNLRFLQMRLSSITDDIWRSILSMDKLVGLYLFDLKADNLDNIPNNFDNLPKLPTLQSFTISYVKCEEKPRVLETILPLFDNVDKIHFELIYLTESICRTIASMKELHTLKLINVSGISDNKIADIFKGCPRLTQDNIKIII